MTMLGYPELHIDGPVAPKIVTLGNVRVIVDSDCQVSGSLSFQQAYNLLGNDSCKCRAV